MASSTTTRRSTLPLAWTIGIGLGIFAAFFVWVWGAQAGHTLWSFLRSQVIVLASTLMVAGPIAYYYLVHVPRWRQREEEARRERGGSIRHSARHDHDFPGSAVAITVAWSIAGTAIIVLAVLYQGFLKGQKYFDSVKIVDTQVESLNFRERAPFDVASAVSDRTLGDTNGDSSGRVKSIPTAEENGIYTTSVIRRGVFQGYESTQTLNLPLFGSTGNSNVSFCDFNEEIDLRFGGLTPSNNLWRAIAWDTSPSVKADRDDAFVICDEGTPMVYAPLTKLEGFPVAIRVPAGVAIYNGKTGEFTIEDEYSGKLPIYPNSVASNQREASKAGNGFVDYLFRRFGYEDTSKDEDDPNGSNYAELGLASNDGGTGYFVTPLTPRGSSSQLIALGQVQSGVMKKGELNPYTVNRFDAEHQRQANSAVAARITGEVLSGYRAQGLTVFEIVPSGGGNWTASVGKSQTVLYRAVIAPDGAVSLHEAPEVQGDGEAPGTGASTIDLGKPLDEMTTEELRKAGDLILEELAKRAGD